MQDVARRLRIASGAVRPALITRSKSSNTDSSSADCESELQEAPSHAVPGNLTVLLVLLMVLLAAATWNYSIFIATPVWWPRSPRRRSDEFGHHWLHIFVRRHRVQARCIHRRARRGFPPGFHPRSGVLVELLRSSALSISHSTVYTLVLAVLAFTLGFQIAYQQCSAIVVALSMAEPERAATFSAWCCWPSASPGS